MTKNKPRIVLSENPHHEETHRPIRSLLRRAEAFEKSSNELRATAYLDLAAKLLWDHLGEQHPIVVSDEAEMFADHEDAHRMGV